MGDDNNSVVTVAKLQITHEQNRQIVTPAELRRILRADGESCYCAPETDIEWDAGRCPKHRCNTRHERR